MKKFLTVLLAVAMILSAMPVVSFADDDKVACWTMGDLNTSRAKAYLSGVTAGQKISFFVKYSVSDPALYAKMSMYVRADGSGSKAAYYAPGMDNGGKKVYSGQYIPANAVACEDDWYYIECLTYFDGTYDLFVDRDGSVVTDAQIADLCIDGVPVDPSRVTTAVKGADIDKPVITGELPVWPAPPTPEAVINEASVSLTDSLAFKFFPTFKNCDANQIASATATFKDAAGNVLADNVGYTEVNVGGEGQNGFLKMTYASEKADEDSMSITFKDLSFSAGQKISFRLRAIDGAGTISKVRVRRTYTVWSEEEQDEDYITATLFDVAYGTTNVSMHEESSAANSYYPQNVTVEAQPGGWYKYSWEIGPVVDGDTTLDRFDIRVYFSNPVVGDAFALDDVKIGPKTCTFSSAASINSWSAGDASNSWSGKLLFDDGTTIVRIGRGSGWKGVTGVVDYESAALTADAFVLSGITPQMINDQITCNVMLDGEIIGTKTASVADYLNALKTDEPDYADLADALLVYGGAAQVYTKYNTDNLAAEFTAVSVASPAGPVVNNGSEDYKVKSAALHYSDSVSVVFKLVLADTSDVVVYLNGVAVEPELVSGNVYKVSTAPIMFSGLLDAQTVEIEVGGQTISSVTYYGVDSAAFKFGYDDNAYGHLVNALYNVAKIAAAL